MPDTKIKIPLIIIPVLFGVILLNCAGTISRQEEEKQLINSLQNEQYDRATQQFEKFKTNKLYQKKDKALFLLNKGTLLHYEGKADTSNEILEQAEQTMEELFTRSISKGILSMLLNDNVLDYSGEIYDELYVNIFKALNYLQLKNFDDSYVEIKRINDKLALMDTKYATWVENLNEQDTTGIKIEKKTFKFYDDALAHYLSYLIFRSEGEEDNARISYEKLKETWIAHPEVYDYTIPEILNEEEPRYEGSLLNLIVFTGNFPLKYPVGGEITTYKNGIAFSDVNNYRNNSFMPFPGMEEGYHFKFAFPEMRLRPSVVHRIDVSVNDSIVGNLELLEDMGKVAVYTFELKKNIIYTKTLIRTVVKGLASAKAKKELRKEADVEDNFILRHLINAGVDAIVDATENPDLRCWNTLPQKCYIGEIELEPGVYNIDLNFYNENNELVKTKNFPNVNVSWNFDLLEAFYLK
jgi:hypothetical protein